MSAVAILAADGFETIECLTIVDVLRRGGVRATLVSIMPTRDVISAQQISVSCDCTFDEVDFSEYDYVVLPGGMPGTTNLQNDGRVCDVVREFAATKHVAAICAAPSILAHLGLLEGRRATCFPGFELDSPKAPMQVARPSLSTAISSRRRPWDRHFPLPSPFLKILPERLPSPRFVRVSSCDLSFAIAASH